MNAPAALPVGGNQDCQRDAGGAPDGMPRRSHLAPGGTLVGDAFKANFWARRSPAIVPTELKGLKTKGAAVFGNTSGPLYHPNLYQLARDLCHMRPHSARAGREYCVLNGPAAPYSRSTSGLFAPGAANFGAGRFPGPGIVPGAYRITIASTMPT